MLKGSLYTLHDLSRVSWVIRHPWDTWLLATDISQEVLSKAKAAQYQIRSVKGGQRRLEKYFVKQSDTTSYTVALGSF